MLQGLLGQVQSITPSLQQTIGNVLLMNENLVRLNTNMMTAMAQVGSVLTEQSAARNRVDQLFNEVQRMRTAMDDFRTDCKQEAQKQTQLLQDVRLLLLQHKATSSPASAPVSPALSARPALESLPTPLSPTAPSPTAAGATNATAPATDGIGLLPLAPMPVAKPRAPCTVLSTLVRTSVAGKGKASGDSQNAADLFVSAWMTNRGEPPPTDQKQKSLINKRCMLLFNGLLLETEKAELLNKPKNGPDKQNWDGNLKRLAKKIHSLAVKFIIAAYKEKGADVGRLTVSSTLKVSTIDNKYRTLNWCDATVQMRTAPDALKTFRTKVEAEEAKKRPAPAETSAPATSAGVKSVRAAVKSSHVQQNALTSMGNCSHALGHCKPTNTTCSQCPKLVCLECALVLWPDDLLIGYVCPDHLHCLPRPQVTSTT